MWNIKFTLIVFIALTIGSVDGFSYSSIIKRSTVRSLKMTDLPLLVDSSYNLAAGCAVIGTACGVLENFKGLCIKKTS